MRNYNHEEILGLEKRFRTNLINSLSGFKSLNLIGTTSKSGNLNLSIVNSVIHIGSNPPLMGFIMRPVSVTRDTYNNIKETGYFTINHINENIYRKSHQCAARYPSDISEFEETGLTAQYINGFPAPFVSECKITIGLKLAEEQLIKTNKTILIIGSVQQLILPEEIINVDGFVDIAHVGTVAGSGLDTYYSPKKLERLSYAKPNRDIMKIV